MTVPGETISHGLSPRCSDCGLMPKIDVYSTPAGYYIGTRCDCGPYSRESGYYRTREAAQAALADGSYGRR
jgi:hypothetical protein